jgi:polyhydroxybutyrate depolymerase
MSALARLTLSIAASIAAFVTLAETARAQGLPSGGKAVDSCPIDGGCPVEGGFYRIMLPPPMAAGRRPGAIMFFHGWQGSADETMSDQGLVDIARGLGVALIAPDGMGKTWSYPGSPGHHRDEFAFVAQVLDDVVRRFAVDPDAVMASGFSQGASMVWNLACRMPTRFHAFAPIAGAFWEPLPADCAGPRPNLIHFHGTSDPTVPLAGRSLRQGYKQGDVFKSLAIVAPGCTASWAANVRSAEPPATLSCRVASGCSGPARLELCLHPGGHYADPAWVERAWKVAMPTGAPVAATGAKLTFP